MKELVDLRRTVKVNMTKETGLKYWELDIRQQAIKLTANRFVSMVLACVGNNCYSPHFDINFFLFILNTVYMDVWGFLIQDFTLSL